MTHHLYSWRGIAAIFLPLLSLAGCQNLGQGPSVMHATSPPDSAVPGLGPSPAGGNRAWSWKPTIAAANTGRSGSSLSAEGDGNVTPRQAADIQVAVGRSLEKRRQVTQAMAAYREAVKRDPGRADAHWRLAVLHDQQGQFTESAGYYRKALATQPGNADVYCDMAYGLYLQQRWADAELNARQAIALAPDHCRAHNNLGLVLAHAGRWDEALAAFRRGAANEADAHLNLAFVLTLERHWPEARMHYQRALAVNPDSSPAKQGLEKLDALMTKVEGQSLQPRARETPAEEAQSQRRGSTSTEQYSTATVTRDGKPYGMIVLRDGKPFRIIGVGAQDSPVGPAPSTVTPCVSLESPAERGRILGRPMA